ncbi:hypothetical protein Vretimale_1200 [Volvox reticuliferus]|uniref:Uncharacterized protein n=1 Tax=Volvox reticuliferus TaxID=1737510 RepID=A0A8J4D979_9CHLO|nr:hypothetical protein Vretifemale_10281 [Volvox reticuliferus]GIL95121.1 hypothetical protein Vretimale_1200 [Volvox reticuliferus]
MTPPPTHTYTHGATYLHGQAQTDTHTHVRTSAFSLATISRRSCASCAVANSRDRTASCRRRSSFIGQQEKPRMTRGSQDSGGNGDDRDGDIVTALTPSHMFFAHHPCPHGPHSLLRLPHAAFEASTSSPVTQPVRQPSGSCRSSPAPAGAFPLSPPSSPLSGEAVTRHSVP